MSRRKKAHQDWPPRWEGVTPTERCLTRVRLILTRYRPPLPPVSGHYAPANMVVYRVMRKHYLRLEAYLELRMAR